MFRISRLSLLAVGIILILTPLSAVQALPTAVSTSGGPSLTVTSAQSRRSLAPTETRGPLVGVLVDVRISTIACRNIEALLATREALTESQHRDIRAYQRKHRICGSVSPGKAVVRRQTIRDGERFVAFLVDEELWWTPVFALTEEWRRWSWWRGSVEALDIACAVCYATRTMTANANDTAAESSPRPTDSGSDFEIRSELMSRSLPDRISVFRVARACKETPGRIDPDESGCQGIYSYQMELNYDRLTIGCWEGENDEWECDYVRDFCSEWYVKSSIGVPNRNRSWQTLKREMALAGFFASKDHGHAHPDDARGQVVVMKVNDDYYTGAQTVGYYDTYAEAWWATVGRLPRS